MVKEERNNRITWLGRGCSIVGTILLVALILICVPLTVPRMFGYHIYTVVSGSMEPAIPTGSLVYVQTIEPDAVEEADVIAFYGASDGSSIITHRVVTNSTIMGEFITKGDANEENDVNPVPYSHFIGKVTTSVPYLGSAAQMVTSSSGKVVAAGMIAGAILLHLIAAILGKRGE